MRDGYGDGMEVGEAEPTSPTYVGGTQSEPQPDDRSSRVS